MKILRQDCITVGGSDSSWQLAGVTKRPKDLRFDGVGFPVADAECWGCELEGCWAQLLAGKGLRGTLERLRMTMQRRVDHQKHSSIVSKPGRWQCHTCGTKSLFVEYLFLFSIANCRRKKGRTESERARVVDIGGMHITVCPRVTKLQSLCSLLWLKSV